MRQPIVGSAILIVESSDDEFPQLCGQSLIASGAIVRALGIVPSTDSRESLIEGFTNAWTAFCLRASSIPQRESLPVIPTCSAQDAGRAALPTDIVIVIGEVNPRYLPCNVRSLVRIVFRDETKYGPGTIGYQERTAGEPQLLITCTLLKDARAFTLRKVELPIEAFDVSSSLRVKAETAALQLLPDLLRQLESEESLVESSAVSISVPGAQNERGYWREIRHKNMEAIRSPLDPLWRSMVRQLFQAVRLALWALAMPYLAFLRARLERRKKAAITIFYYHGIGNGGENWMMLPLDEFHSQLRYIRRYFTVFSMDEAVARLRSGANDQTGVVLSFDDGYSSCHRNALPYLRMRNVPAAFFVCAKACAEGNILPHDSSRGFDRAKLMTSAQIRDLADAGFTVGSHGNYHENMSQLSGHDLRAAIIESADFLERMTGRAVKYMSFPRGRYSKEAMAVARERYDAVFSAHDGYNLPGRDRFQYLRISNPMSMKVLVPVVNGFHRLRPFAASEREEMRD
jgi:peptidoglycan/xylan/chitin deacetylase (PgdA/CDA1 family)